MSWKRKFISQNTSIPEYLGHPDNKIKSEQDALESWVSRAAEKVLTLFACFSQMSVAGDKEQYRRESYFKLNVDCNHDNVGNSHSKDSITFRLFSPYKELWSKKLVIKADTSSTNLLTKFNAT